MSDLVEVLPEFDLQPFTHLLHSLEKNDITVADLVTLDPKEIARRCPLPSADVQKLVADVVLALQQDLQGAVTRPKEIKGTKSPSVTRTIDWQSGEAALPKDQKARTLDGNIDQALGGGFRPGHITEIVGESAVGKTQFVLGLLLSVQLAPPRGLGRDAIYVSTEAPLNTGRLKQMLVSHPEYESLQPEDRPSLDHVHAIATSDLEAQEHIIRFQLPVAVRRFNVGLIVVDSVAANFRAEHETRTPAGLAERAVELSKLGSMLRRVAVENNIVVVVTNQVSDRFEDNVRNVLRSSPPIPTPSPAAVLAPRADAQCLDHQQRFFTGWGDERAGEWGQLKNPALGLAWSNQISARIVLKMESERQEYSGGNIWKDKKKRRTFAVVFAPWTAPTKPPIPYEIGMQGIISTTAESLSTRVNESDDELLKEELWATDDDEEFP